MSASGQRDRLRSGEALIGTFLGLGSSGATEICAMSGFDWLLIDLEHGRTTETALAHHLAVCDVYEVAPYVRVETLSRSRVGRALDLGAAGIMLPRVETADHARSLVRHMSYPPAGDRGVATSARSSAYGLKTDHLVAPTHELLCIVQIESSLAVENLDEIAGVDGVDVLFVGPRDLSHDLGIPADYANPAFQSALAQVLKTCARHGRAAGILAGSLDHAEQYLDMGFTFVGVQSEATMLAAAAVQTVTRLKA